MERRIFSSANLFFGMEVMAIVTVGIDLAKNVFAVHGVDESITHKHPHFPHIHHRQVH
jgi:hypothetical protein